MAEPTQFMFSNKELVAALLKQQGIHTGKWSLAVEFALGVGTAGPSATEAMPTAMASVARVGIQQTQDVNSVTYDAQDLNPAPTKPKRRTPVAKG